MPKIGADRRAARREQFLSAAREAATRRGYRALTVDDVCAAAGLSKGAFYAHFSAKQDLLAAMFDAEIAEVDALLSRLEATDTSQLDRVRTYLRSMVLRGEDPTAKHLRAEVWSQAVHDPAFAARLAEEVRSRRLRLAAFAEAGARNGEMVPLPANALGAVLVALVDGLLLHHSVDPAGFRWENVRKVVDILLDGLGPAP